MSYEDGLHPAKQLAWVVVTALCWLYAPYTSTPRFGLWFWGIAFWIDVSIFGAFVTIAAVKRIP